LTLLAVIEVQLSRRCRNAIEVEFERQDLGAQLGEGSFQGMNTRKEPAMAATPESFVDALNSAFGKQTTQRSAHAKGVAFQARGAGHGALLR
jgi:hypothetical protein